MGLNYEREAMSKRHADQNYFNRLARKAGGDFPQCHGMYEDCPEKPSLLDAKCRNCPQAEDVKKPRLEWIECEHCKEEGVPFVSESKKDQNEDTKCHICGKMNSANYILGRRN